MTELVAAALVAVAALAYVLDPLTRSSGSETDGAEVNGASREQVELLVREMREQLLSHCGSCGAAAPPGSAFCPRCGKILVSR